jgi:hypothetical protein
MKRLMVLALFLCVSVCGLRAQVVDTTVCAILKAPASFNNKMVRIKGTVSVGTDFFVIKDLSCGLEVNSIWIDYPERSKGKAGPAAVVILQPARNFAGKVVAQSRIPVTLERDGEFKKFDSLLSSAHDEGNGICVGCVDNDVMATLVGRLDGVAKAEIQHSGGKIVGLGGFGNFGAYPARIVLQSVSDVVAKRINYKTTDYHKGKAPYRGPTTALDEHSAGAPVLADPLDEAEHFAMGLGGVQGGAELVAAGQVFPPNAKRSGNGVNVTIDNSSLNEDEKYETQSEEDSPDGVIYNCFFDHSRMPRDAIQLGIFHIGKHIVDVRTPPVPGTSTNLYSEEYNDWVMTAEAAALVHENAVALPGSYQLWIEDWPQEQQSNNVDQGITDYLTKQQGLTK